MDTSNFIKLLDRGVANISTYAGKPHNPKAQDTVAQFLAHELTDDFDPAASDIAQIKQAKEALELAMFDLESVYRVIRAEYYAAVNQEAGRRLPKGGRNG